MYSIVQGSMIYYIFQNVQFVQSLWPRELYSRFTSCHMKSWWFCQSFHSLYAWSYFLFSIQTLRTSNLSSAFEFENSKRFSCNLFSRCTHWTCTVRSTENENLLNTILVYKLTYYWTSSKETLIVNLKIMI